LTLVLATHNRDKGRELAARLSELPLKIRGLWEWPDHPPIDETGSTLEENARLKAQDALAHTGHWAIADDTGLMVDALDGAPGVLSARFAGPGATYESNRQLLLERLSGVPPGRRGARFETVVAFARPEADTVCVRGWVDGEILAEERGLAGFGYDAVFYHPGSGKSFAELTLEEKNAVSHRGRAILALRQVLMAALQEAGLARTQDAGVRQERPKGRSGNHLST
jgi:XTP/dITP diphosphohydrolase